MSIYYTYHLYHKLTDKNYYGVRYAKGCHPSDLWTIYFSSSKEVRKLIEEHGRDSFVAQVRKTFPTKDAAIEWETRFLRKINAANNDRWLNRSNGDKNFRGTGLSSDKQRRASSKANKGKIVSEETRQKIRDARKRQAPPSEETRRKISESNKNRVHSEETRRKLSDAQKGRVFSKESRAKMSEARRNITEETRLKLSLAKKGQIPWNKGKK